MILTYGQDAYDLLHHLLLSHFHLEVAFWRRIVYLYDCVEQPGSAGNEIPDTARLK